jgi:hypothetical protein
MALGGGRGEARIINIPTNPPLQRGKHGATPTIMPRSPADARQRPHKTNYLPT